MANYKLPDPLGYFFRKHALSVVTSQIVDQILPRYLANRELSAVGGDGEAEELLIKNLNPFKRKTQPPVVYWSGILSSDEQVRHLSYTVPTYFNGSLRVMAVAVADDAVGSIGKQTTVRGDFVVSPNVPTFVAPGDTFTVSASIVNNVKDDKQGKPIIVALSTTPELSIVGSPQQAVNIAPGNEGTVQFNLRANPKLGNAELVFSAAQGDLGAKMTETLSVRPASAYQTILETSFTRGASKKINLVGQWYSEHYLSQIVAGQNPLILADGLQTFLENYPYDCTEQLISKAFAALALTHQSLVAFDKQTLQAHFDAIIQLLRQRQNSDGSINYWPNGSNDYNNHFATVYAMDYLIEAAKNGYAVPEDLLKAGLDYLQEFVGQSMTGLPDIRLQAQAIYELTRGELVTSDYITNLLATLKQQPKLEWQKDITSAYLAAALKLLKDDSEADRLIKLYAWNKKEYSEEDFYNRLASDAQYVNLLARHFPEQLANQTIVQLAESLDKGQLNTLSAAYTVSALTAYSARNDYNATFSVSEWLSNKTKRLLSSTNTRFFQANISPNTNQLFIENPEKAVLFYQIKQAGFSKELFNSAAQHGLEINRTYYGEKKASIAKLKLGNELNARVQLRSTTSKVVNNVAVVDLLPGGFSVVPNSVSAPDCDYYDVREDRIVFYCRASETVSTLVYRIRAVNQGTYWVPPVLAAAMYNANVWGRGLTGKLVVE